MKIEVDFDRCEANGVCMRLAPEVFRVDDNDQLEVLAGSPPEALRVKVEKAVRHCPKQALSLIDD